MRNKAYEIHVVKDKKIIEAILMRNPGVVAYKDTLIIELDYFEKQAVVNICNQLLVPINFKHAKRLLG